ncbi:phage/plasmid primase, P4 family [Mesorhizobium sp. WSM2561]|uniref:phage/plasmid primase, P4 family n=1 Tax=Mesorhizobium sp. WSM2561 TaxID=1040985 RepID=UPI0004AD1784|nr:phage/plasmid primase, P4 family [Mesorhizobium sp. WSM2561]
MKAGFSADRHSVSELLRLPVREGSVDGITRFEALSIVIGHFVREARLGRISLAEAWDKVREYNTRLVIPSWPEERLKDEFRSLQYKDGLWHGGPSNVPGADSVSSFSSVTEDALADRFSEQSASDWRCVAGWSGWLKWVGTRWQLDSADEVFEVIRQICRAAAVSAQAADIRRIRSDRIRAVERIARSDPRHSALPEEFDPDTMLLNTPAGTVDLRTGEIGPHLRAAAMTRQTAASPGRNCPMWEEFLDEITGGDPALLAYLARVAGYCLSGDTSEQVFFFLHGAGANGKSVFLSVLADVLGDYGVTAPLETFMAGKGERHPTDLAGLRGARLVTVNETESGRAWAESRIKSITGGDKLRVRFMHRDFFEFQPTFKLLIAGNHRPRLSGVGEAMRRRLHLVPFEVTIPPERRDRQLLLKLKTERDGSLGWMLEGCADWLNTGLAPPACVVDAAHEYFEGEDDIGQWIDEECQRDRSKSAAASALFASWAGWADRHGLERGSLRDLGEALKARGFEPKRSARSRGWQSIVLMRVPGASVRGDAS